MKIPVPLLSRSLRWVGVFIVAAAIFYASLVTVPGTGVNEAEASEAVVTAHETVEGDA